ncbi:geranyl diphosphate synthase / farnesyl diphosphate synthase [Campylobacter pinnipediorum subsp. caledonicus]|uniref:Geranyl diphosphate synthase / farnesyl diphosphate synthase n=1 Tax=Campylobacter pinnipediorum subsp. caledonicus TaxID=1874362 RepID=A0A1S6U9E7_9BACT|nr:polyprenyl synthetase family protein [Campylobacter pinnipediorum]AQW86643.1 geranyl diphosphate synthase / farnesyl diphosphate synthase [Campylobacter pinnipediorum subsp. caledonicus]AQW88292.1 geranyl diphosphate synthase / farnesyl diphosphate synthase [Campylobacter pinnipediorum subsp. caledonicus]OPA70569.1 geranyl transferase [Campylobacter pinnipediorum subsp. caledonicus]
MSDKFVDFLNENLPTSESFHPYYSEALSHVLKAGGKHFRASLLLGVVNAIKPELTDKAMRVALGVELLHTYSLIHDDLPAMDNAPLRRGVETLHVKYDEVTAILVGDALNTHAFFEISRSDLPSDILLKCIEILSFNGGVNGMVLGQALDCYFEGKKLDLKQVEFLHIHKTAKLIAASLQMGAVIASCDENTCSSLYKIGLDLGLAFQIQDDIIDATSNEAEAGKPVHNDDIKNSFINLMGLDGAKNSKEELIRAIIKELEIVPSELRPVIEKLINKYLKG